MDGVVCIGVVSHLQVVPLVAVNVAPVDPEHIVASAALIVGADPIVITPVAVPLHIPVVPVTVQVLVSKGASVNVATMLPGPPTQTQLVAPVAVKVAVLPGQTAAGGGITPTIGF